MSCLRRSRNDRIYTWDIGHDYSSGRIYNLDGLSDVSWGWCRMVIRIIIAVIIWAVGIVFIARFMRGCKERE